MIIRIREDLKQIGLQIEKHKLKYFNKWRTVDVKRQIYNLKLHSNLLDRRYDLLLKTIAQIVPEKMIAGTYSSVCGTIMAGVHPDTGATFVMIEPEIGGWGASNAFDGDNAQYSTLHGDT